MKNQLLNQGPILLLVRDGHMSIWSYSKDRVMMISVLLLYLHCSHPTVYRLSPPPLLIVNSDGIIALSFSSRKFMIMDIVYARLRKDCVVNLCPYVPLNDMDERSCYFTLLIHIPWPIEGDDFISRGYKSAVDCLSILKSEEKIPGYEALSLYPGTARYFGFSRKIFNPGISLISRDHRTVTGYSEISLDLESLWPMAWPASTLCHRPVVRPICS